MTLAIYLTGAIIMFVSAVIFDRERLRELRKVGKTFGMFGWETVTETDAIMTAFLGYLILAVFWPITMPGSIIFLGIREFTNPER